MAIGTDQQIGVAAERLLWPVGVGGRSHRLDLTPAAFGRSVAIEVDGRSVGRIPKPTPQRPWRDTAVTIESERFVVGLTWHFPVMRTDVFVGGRSLRDGRTLDDVRADAPDALTNYEVWLGGLFRTPFFGSRPRPTRSALPVILLALAVWVTVLVASPLAPEFRVIGAAAWLAASVVLMLIYLWSWLVFSERVHHSLLARPQLGDARRILAFFAAYVAYPVVSMLVAGALLVLLSRSAVAFGSGLWPLTVNVLGLAG